MHEFSPPMSLSKYRNKLQRKTEKTLQTKGSSKIQVGKQNLLTLEKSNFPVIKYAMVLK